MSKKSMVALLEAWEDQKDQYDTMKDFVESFYQDAKSESKTRAKSKKKEEEESRDESEGSNEAESKTRDEVTPRVKVNLLVPSSKSKKKEKKTETKSRGRKKIITEMGEEKKPTVKQSSKYLDFLKQWREDNPEIKGKEAIKQGAAAWQEHKKVVDFMNA